MNRSLLIAGFLLVALTGCGERLTSIKPTEFARPGHKSSLPRVIYEEKSTKARVNLPEFTFINLERNFLGFDQLDITKTQIAKLEQFNTIGVNPRNITDPTKHNRVTRSLKEIQDFNASVSCEGQLNDIAEIKSLYPYAILICEKHLAEMINNASTITIDSQSYTSWSHSTFEFLSARVMIHNF